GSARANTRARRCAFVRSRRSSGRRARRRSWDRRHSRRGFYPRCSISLLPLAREKVPRERRMRAPLPRTPARIHFSSALTRPSATLSRAAGEGSESELAQVMIEMAPAERAPRLRRELPEDRMQRPLRMRRRLRKRDERLAQLRQIRIPVVRLAARHDFTWRGRAARKRQPVDEQMFQRPVAERTFSRPRFDFTGGELHAEEDVGEHFA